MSFLDKSVLALWVCTGTGLYSVALENRIDLKLHADVGKPLQTLLRHYRVRIKCQG